MATQREWVDWLVQAGVGVDYNLPDPPCTLRELAESWNRTPGGVHEDELDGTAAWEVMAWVIQGETGMFVATVEGETDE